jgi:co-chaperonin GroES (HSP10)
MKVNFKNSVVVVAFVLMALYGGWMIRGISIPMNNGKHPRYPDISETGIEVLDENATFKNGDQLQFELKDGNGSALAGQQLNISYSKDKNQSYTVVTDSNGKYSLILDNVTAGDNVVIVKYAGNDKYHDYELQKTITIV